MEASDFLISLFRDNFFCASLEGEMEEGKKSKKKKNEKLESRRREEREEFNEFKFEIKFFFTCISINLLLPVSIHLTLLSSCGIAFQILGSFSFTIFFLGTPRRALLFLFLHLFLSLHSLLVFCLATYSLHMLEVSIFLYFFSFFILFYLIRT